MEDWTYSPDNWIIQDLDMYPQDRVPNLTIKSEVNTGPSCGYQTAQSCSTPGRPQTCPAPTYPNHGGQNTQFVQNGMETYPNSGDWPEDLDNIVLDSSLPNECDSPLKLEDFDMQFVYVNPSTLDQSSASTASPQSSAFQNTVCSTMKYGTNPVGVNPVNKLPANPSYYEQLPTTPYNTSEVVKQELLPPSCIPSNPAQTHGRPVGTRGRPRNEWRITNKKKGCVGRPRTKSLRPGRPISDTIKKEIFDDQYSDLDPYGDPSDEKKERRREQNRRAARKLREKKKVHVENMKKSYEGIVQDNRRLTAEVEDLKQLVEQLRTARDSHVCRCTDVFTPSPASSTSQANSTFETRYEKQDMTSMGVSHLAMELAHMDR